MEIEDAGRNSDNSPLWVKLKAYRWYEPSLWLLLISAPSPLLRSDHRRRARLFSLILFVILVTGIIINSLAAPGSQQFYALLAANICLSFAYLASRTRHYKLASSASVFLLWTLTIVTVAFNAMNNTFEDVTVTDPTNWLFLPALYCVCAVFLSRTGTVSVVVTDFVGSMVLPFIVNTTYFSMRKFLFFHCVMDVLLLLASIIHFRDKLQLYYSAQGISDPEAHMESRLGRLLVRPHDAVSDRILRRRTRILSLCLLILIPANILWCISEFHMNGDSSVIGLAVGYLASIIILYVMSRSPLYKWASRATLAGFLLFPYFFSFCPSTTPEGAMFANLLANSAAAVLGIALLAGEDLVTLAAIIFFPTIYSPFFPPHVAMSIMLLAAALISRDEHEELVSAGDTAAEIPEDEDAANQKMYLGGRFTYLQAARYSFLAGFICCFVLGLTPLVAVLHYDGPQFVNSKGSLSSEVAANYRLFITVGHCPTELPQQYTVIGSTSRLYFTYEGALVENTVNSLNVFVSPSLGTLKMISVTLGSGDWKLGQNEVCEILNIQILDVASGSSVATNSLPPLANSGTTQGKKFSTQARQDRDDDEDDDCTMATSRNTCGAPSQMCSVRAQTASVISALICFLRDCSRRGKCAALDAQTGFCTCDIAFTGDNCERSWRDQCSIDGRLRSDDGVCNFRNDPRQGQLNRIFPRDTSPRYLDFVGSINTSLVSSLLVAKDQICNNTKRSSLYKADVHNVWANAFLNLVLDDVADFKGTYSQANSYTLADSRYRIFRQPYKDGVKNADKYADIDSCADTSCSCQPTTCGKKNQTIYRPRYYVNAQTPSFDGSATYGAGRDRCSRFRLTAGGLFRYSFFGKFKYLMKNSDGLIDMITGNNFKVKSMYMIGDGRGNANPLSIALHTMIMLNHNRIATNLKTCLDTANVPNALLFDAARLVNVAQLHQILRELLGALDFNPDETPCSPENDALTMSLETTLFMNWFDGRPDTVTTAAGCETPVSFPALTVAFDTGFFETQGLNKIVQGALRQPIVPGVAQSWCEFDGTKIGRPESKTNIAASLIELARDLGLGSYNDVRAAYCLPLYTCSPSDYTFPAAVCAYYGNDASKVELPVGMLFDKGVIARTMFLGALNRLLANDNFQPRVIQSNLGDGTVLADIRSKYLKGLQCVRAELNLLTKFTFKSLISSVTAGGVPYIQDNAFFLPNRPVGTDNGNLCQGNSPTNIPTSSPITAYPTPVPSLTPTNTPTPLPTRQPTNAPTTRQPTNDPTPLPTRQPTNAPTTKQPTLVPTPPTPFPTGPTTLSPTTRSPSTAVPTTTAPTTQVPSTVAPTTRAPTRAPTNNPTTSNPTTSPTTISPTTKSPTTKSPTTTSPTNSPTTTNPTTKNPTTKSPTRNPTTVSPTASPTTLNPTTRNPTTKSPTKSPTRVPTTGAPNSPAPTNPTGQPTATPSTSAPTSQPTSQPSNIPTTSVPTDAPTTQPTTSHPTLAPSVSPTLSPTAAPTPAPCPTTQYHYDGRCNAYNNRNFYLPPPIPDASLPTVASLSTNLFGSSVDRGKSRLTALAVAYTRFFLSDVLEVLESDTTVTPLSGCSSGVYLKITNQRNYQTPVMDLSPIFGNSDLGNAMLKSTASSDRLCFTKVFSGENNTLTSNLGHVMIGRGSTDSVYLSGSPNSNVDHFSIYLHSRFFYLHTKMVDLLNADNKDPPAVSSNLAIFESARVFVVMVAETIARDLARDLGTLPSANFDFTSGIPSEFLLISFIDRFPSQLALYGDASRDDTNVNTPPICSLPTVSYESTTYNIAAVANASTDIDDLAWVGYDAMYTRANNGGSLAAGSRCSTGVGRAFGSPFDPIAAVIQRGRDFLFPSCQSYRVSKGLPSVTFADFGNDAFAKVFAAQYGNDFSKVELSVCLFLDSNLRDRMMGSLILNVLSLQNTTSLCTTLGKADLTAFGTTPVATLYNFGSAATDSSNLAFLLQAVCSLGPRIDLRGLALAGQLNFGLGTTINYATSTRTTPTPGVDRFVVCTTANPFLAPNAKYIPTRSILKESSGTPVCDWASKDPNNNGTSLFLNNAPKCNVGTNTRRCFCLARDGCDGRGVPASNGLACTCDTGYVRVVGNAANAYCERFSYPQTPHLYEQFGFGGANNYKCSISYTDANLPVDGTNFPLNSYCLSSTCSLVEGHYLIGSCNNASNADAGRVGSALGRIVPANYPNNFNYTIGPSWSSAFQTAFPQNPTTLSQNVFFRGMGKLLLNDAFSTSNTYFDENGLRTSDDASNPAQFKNLATGWLDESNVFPLPTPYGASVWPTTGNGFLPPTYAVITDEAEKAMRSIFGRRYNQLMRKFLGQSPCADVSCDPFALGRCVREIALLEYRSIAREFLAEAKRLFPSPKSFTPDNRFVAPVELAGAKLFDLHFAAASVTPFCGSLDTVSADPASCLNAAQTTPLVTQRDLSAVPAATLDAIGNQVKALGLGSLNSYLAKLDAAESSYSSLSTNLLLDLHGSEAEYAFNFGILEHLLDQDSRSDIANATCLANLQFAANTNNVQLANSLTVMIPIASTRTLCSLILDMGSSVYNPEAVVGVNARPDLFRVSPLSGVC